MCERLCCDNVENVPSVEKAAKLCHVTLYIENYDVYSIKIKVRVTTTKITGLCNDWVITL